jgi:hypothetical protein
MSKVTKFQTILASTGQAVLDKRAGAVLKAAKNAMKKKLDGLNDRKDELELQILNLTDLSVETKDSLRPGDKNFNANAWVNELCNKTIELTLLEQEIEVVEAVNAEYFEETVEVEDAK